MSNLNDIWTADEGGMKLTEEQLLAYLEGRLPDEEVLAVEALLAKEGMESDALEGLRELHADEAKNIRRQLNAGLQQTLGKKRRKRRGVAGLQGNIVAVVVLVLLILMCFLVFWMMRHKG